MKSQFDDCKRRSKRQDMGRARSRKGRSNQKIQPDTLTM